MSLFFKTFIKVFAILSSISVFFILLIMLPIFLSKIENEKIFIHSKGDANCLNKNKYTGKIYNHIIKSTYSNLVLRVKDLSDLYIYIGEKESSSFNINDLFRLKVEKDN